MSLSAAQIVGLLAERDRQLVVAAVLLGNGSRATITEATGLDIREVTRALERLVGAGLIVEDDASGKLVVHGDAFKQAARSEAVAPTAEDFDGASDDEQVILGRFISDGRLLQMPSKWSHRVIILDWAVQRFTPGRRYDEVEVNAMLSEIDDDYATLRRYLVEAGMLDRADGQYWRSGGTVRL